MQTSLKQGCIHIYKCDWAELAQDAINELRGWLTEDEMQRASRYRITDDGTRFVVGRAMLRIICERYLGVDGKKIRIENNKFGKPYPADHEDELYFNISHSDDWVIAAFAKDFQIGVDVEKIDTRAEFNFRNVAKYSFHPDEIAEFEKQPESLQRQKFTEIWSAKEAVIKALGSGFNEETTKFSILPLPEKNEWQNMGEQQWCHAVSQISYCLLDIDNRHTGAVAVCSAAEGVEVEVLGFTV